MTSYVNKSSKSLFWYEISPYLQILWLELLYQKLLEGGEIHSLSPGLFEVEKPGVNRVRKAKKCDCTYLKILFGLKVCD